MVDNLLKYIFAALLVWAFCLPARCREFLPSDTLLVFKKMPQDTVVVKRGNVKKREGKKRSSSKKKTAAKAKVAAAKRRVKGKSDSVRYEEKRYSLGDRVIMKGDSGADVKKLAEIMVKNLYIDEKDIPYTKSGKVLYEGALLRAVKLFQKVSGLYDDGIVGSTTIKELRKIHRWRRSPQ